MESEPHIQPDREQRLEEVVLSYLQAVDAGRGPDPKDILARHPDLATDLEAFFAGSGQLSPLRALVPDSSATDPALNSLPGYQVLGAISEGGMGAVWRARDSRLGREVAVKVMLDRFRGHPDAERRFVEEARVGGQLQHPGVVPVYELGEFSDHRPYFAMKLVQGRTLAALLAERADPSQDLPRFLGILEQVSQTLAYAHARGVVHRDLKPLNIMVGEFGEVQVMDWGLAKVLGKAKDAAGQPPPAEEAADEDVAGTTVEAGWRTAEGQVLGTLPYMPPEQARGEVDRLDERCDVFALGSIVCEILTGRPAYTGRDQRELHRQAVQGDLADAHVRLDSCGADPELVKLAKACLAVEPADRPRDAGVAARAGAAYREGREGRLRQAELDRAAAEARAVEERKRRRLTVALAASVLLLAGVGGGGAWWLQQQRQATVQGVELLLGKADTLEREAEMGGGTDLSLARLREALAYAEEAEQTLRGGLVPAELARRVRQRQAQLQENTEALDRDRRVVTELTDIRTSKEDRYGERETEAEYARAFLAYGIDMAALPAATEEVAQRVRSRPAVIQVELAGALDDWILERVQRRRGTTTRA